LDSDLRDQGQFLSVIQVITFDTFTAGRLFPASVAPAQVSRLQETAPCQI